MRVRTVTGMAVAVLVALLWLAITAQPAAAMACARMPGFAYRFINTLLEIDFFNQVIINHGHLEGVAFINRVVEDFNVTLKIYGIENIPETGRYIFVSNHPLGGFDGMLLLKVVDEHLGDP